VEPWYKVAIPRREVREGRSFSPDEFAIALEQVIAGTAPEDYSKPEQFFSRTCFTRALKDHAGMVLRRLSGETVNTAPVLTLITQFGGGKTHTLAALYHLANAGSRVAELPGVGALLDAAGLATAPAARVGVFVGNAWDPRPGHETPWIDLARQIAADEGVAALGPAAKTTPPGTEAIGRVFAAAEAPVLVLLDEVLNFVNRHRGMAESLHAFIQNLTVAMTGTTRAAAVISLPRSQVEMTDWDQQWQERITKVVRRVAQDLIANDEAEIGEVVRRRLFESIGDERIRRRVARDYADWCFERSARLPAEWLAIDTTATAAKAKDFLRGRFEACYPFHPATLSVFQRKWRALPQFQQTRGTLAMLAQWISWAAREHFDKARQEPLITLGSAPLHIPEFRAVVLGQLGETRLDTAILADIAGEPSHARALDADTRRGPLRDIHRRVGTAILFESSGGQVDKVAHLPELRFALGEPEVETTSVDNAAAALEAASYFLRKVGTDGFRIHHQATLKKVVADRRASLDEETEVKPEIRKLVAAEIGRGAMFRSSRSRKTAALFRMPRG
jgi:predicted AAA+ superfamily ATPase